jgi:hypothetical protein
MRVKKTTAKFPTESPKCSPTNGMSKRIAPPPTRTSRSAAVLLAQMPFPGLCLLAAFCLSACAHNTPDAGVERTAPARAAPAGATQDPAAPPEQTPVASSPRWPARPVKGADTSTDITQEDLRHFAQNWGGHAIRVLHLGMLADRPPYAADEAALEAMYKTAALALDQGLAVVFAPGVAMDNGDAFFGSRAYQKSFVELWKRIATHFKDETRTVAFDLMNEPHDRRARKRWSGYAQELTRAIRAIDSEHTLMVEPPEWGWPAGFKYLKPTGDENTVYSFHTYAPNEFTTQKTPKGFLTATEEQWEARVYPGSVMEGELWNKETMAEKLSPAFEFARKNRVPLWCGEFGTARWARGALEWMRDMISILDAHGVGWAYYAYREWQVMDMEMSNTIKNQPTERADTEFVDLLKDAYR